ncbi:uncharacterized protein PFL1_00052 [Pseudozyma flocculosa PF-1]|uniref:Large ribosomal subunit protein uL30m n=1 Tax=Pseudozyma flocculosa TaxID=84751 RepID=A0A5C3EUL0_9BASI|nr:uncharacterized protein PFL1_00052 [Pseudozyma flocculosa PF-1]EPQ31853.1 hypothetical protein PFL1_00052 [Pseudozyma flocculosa PF-1]SPO35246.1 related to MRPL33 - mitochondrial ribosomal protein, large subunit [Pseudozyma flocculosa]
MSLSGRSLLALVGQGSRRATLTASPVASSSRSMLRFESTSTATSESVAAATGTAPTHYRITLRRSGIGMPAKTNRILSSLGLTKRLQSVYRPIGPEMAGAILAVKELLHVDNVRRLDTPEQQALTDEEAVWVNAAGEVVDAGKSSRKAPRGYRVVGSLVDEARDRQLKGEQQ